MCKLIGKFLRDVQIAFATSSLIYATKAGINVWELIQLANKHPRVNICKHGAGWVVTVLRSRSLFHHLRFSFRVIIDRKKPGKLIITKHSWCAKKLKIQLAFTLT